MKINGNPEGGQGGGLTPQQEALINSVPNKVNQVRLVTDGSVIRHEGALTPLTFSQIYDLVMDNSKYVYIVMDNNIRFRPSAYDGDAIWFDSSFIEEGKPNILRCIINSDNRVDITQIVVASEEYVDEHAGGLDPEQKKAVETLVNSSKGMLYTEDLAPRHINRYDFEGGQTKVVNLDGRVILNRYSELYEFKDLGIHHLGQMLGSFDYNSPMWTDMSGRIYNGQSYKVDLDAMTLEPADLNCMFFNYQTNKCSIFKGQNTVYVYGSNQYQVFDEETQRFGEPQFYSNSEYLDIYSFMLNQIQFGDRLISIYNNQTYELVEDADGIHPEVVDNPFDFDSAPFAVEGGRMFYIDGTWYYMPGYPYEGTYRFVDGTWEQMDMTFPDGNTPYFEGYGVISENMVISHYAQNLFVYNLTDEEKKVTSWAPVGIKAVDLESSQNIGGGKHFKDQISVDGGILTNTVYNTKNISIGAGKNAIVSGLTVEIKSDLITLNGEVAANKNDLIINSDKTKLGMLTRELNNRRDGSISSYTQFYTASGRVFNNFNETMCELVDDEWVPVQLMEDEYMSEFSAWNINNSIVRDSINTFYTSPAHIFKFNEESGKFEVVCDNTSPYSQWYTCGDGMMRKVNWKFDGQQIVEEDNSDFGSPNMTFVMNGITYMFVGTEIYSWDEALKTKTYITNIPLYYDRVYSSYFVVDGKAYFYYNGSMFMFDGTKTIQVFNIYINTNNADCFYGIYNDMVVSYSNDNKICEIYGVNYTKPEVPESDGTYVLKATRVGDQITYTWVAE